jgi:2-oxoglutarate ferredoxin oxidoreductase subunit gamma
MDTQSSKIIIAGFGGQGIVVIGNLIARACVIERKNVVGMVAYGAEMRGGTAYATVVVSDEEIGSPFVDYPDTAIVLNQPSLDKFEKDVRPGGTVLLNTSMTQRPLNRSDLNRIEVDATQIAHDLGNLKVANVVALGAFIHHSKVLTMASIEQGLKDLFSAKNPKLITLNLQALHAGAQQSRFISPDR